MPEPIQSPAAPTTPDFSEISKSIQGLTDLVGGINERLGGFEEQIAGLTPEPDPQPEPEWKPKTWDEFPLKAKEVALQAWEEKEAERRKQEEEEKKQLDGLRTQMDQDFNTQLEKLEKEGVIPAVKDPKDAKDPGKIARKEIFGLGIKNSTSDLAAMAELRNDLLGAGFSIDMTDEKEGKVSVKLVKSNPRPFGADAPVGSSARSSSNANKASYKEIHGLSMDEMVRRYNQ